MPEPPVERDVGRDSSAPDWLDVLRGVGRADKSRLRASSRAVARSGLICDADTALLEEYEAIFGSEPMMAPYPMCPPTAAQARREEWLLNQPKAALCLSGGGVRSAAFCMGALRALAAHGLLRRFHYLSTVSGGGYIGGWLLRIVEQVGSVAEVEELLAGSQAIEQVKNLREFTNFLTPGPGLFSADTITGLVLYLRNLLVTWFIFLPAAASVALLFLFCRDLVCWVSGGYGDVWGPDRPAFVQALSALGLLSLGYGTYQGCRLVPSHAAIVERDGRPELGAEAATIVRLVVAPILLWGALGTLAYAAQGEPGTMPAVSWRFLWLPVAAPWAMLMAYVLAWWRQTPRTEAQVFRANIWFWLMGCLLSSATLWTLAWVGSGADVRDLASFGPLCIVGADMMQSTLYMALRRQAPRADLDREWVARLNGAKLAYGLVFTAGAAATLLLPRLLPNTALGASLMALASGPAGAFVGHSASTAFAPGGSARGLGVKVVDVALPAAAAVFLAGLLMLLGLGSQAVFRLWPGLDGAGRLPWTLIGAAVLLAIGAGININRFSLHALYRNRLVRAFLGSARPEKQRRPDAFTRFDAGDNARLSETFSRRRGRALFPVIGMTLNLVGGRRTAWAERKAAPFTMTPLRCGSAELHHPDLARAARNPAAPAPMRAGATSVPGGWMGAAVQPAGAYARTSCYAGAESMDYERPKQQRGVTLGTAMTISGAAVSPNMGYHSSVAAALLMTLFDVRLGMWLPNPAQVTGASLTGASLTGSPGASVRAQLRRQLNQPRPHNALLTLLREMGGRTDDRGRDIYLSDGGHFDNLGLYEMLRRRCRFIVVIDAGQDGEYGYADLGMALRLASIDLDACVEFIPPLKTGPASVGAAGLYAKITYPSRPDGALGEATGHLLVIKPWLPPDAPAEVAAYAKAHELFPHDPTTNQFFTESQFESYRRLGEFVTAAALGTNESLKDLLERRPDPSQNRAASGHGD